MAAELDLAHVGEADHDEIVAAPDILRMPVEDVEDRLLGLGGVAGRRVGGARGSGERESTAHRPEQAEACQQRDRDERGAQGEHPPSLRAPG
jgi:hypothetical protein